MIGQLVASIVSILAGILLVTFRKAATNMVSNFWRSEGVPLAEDANSADPIIVGIAAIAIGGLGLVDIMFQWCL